MKVVALSGGVGGARLLDGLARALPAEALTAIVNTGDDFVHLGLHVSPDVDTVMYTLAGPSTSMGPSACARRALVAMARDARPKAQAARLTRSKGRRTPIRAGADQNGRCGVIGTLVASLSAERKPSRSAIEIQSCSQLTGTTAVTFCGVLNFTFTTSSDDPTTPTPW